MEINYHSSKNQEILRKLVDREVLMCGTDIVEYILRNCNTAEDAPFTYDDIENNCRKVCSKCDGYIEEIGEDEIEVNHKWICESCGNEFDTKEEAMNCCYSEEDREDLDEDDMVREIWVCPFCEDEHETEEEARDCICHYRETIFKCTDCGNHLIEEEAREEDNEAYEWWFVTDWFAKKLAEHGEMVIRGWNSIWGRGCTGQAILLDSVIGKIAEEMGILEGQEHAWS